MNQETINKILNLASKRRQIVYGQRAINQQIPTYLKRKTMDFDIYTKKPESAARELSKLDNKFRVVKAIYGRTWKVKNELNETIADYTQPSRHPKYVNILGVRYADIYSAQRKIKKILRDKNSSYRWEKDKDMLNRIKKGLVKVW